MLFSKHHHAARQLGTNGHVNTASKGLSDHMTRYHGSNRYFQTQSGIPERQDSAQAKPSCQNRNRRGSNGDTFHSP